MLKSALNDKLLYVKDYATTKSINANSTLDIYLNDASVSLAPPSGYSLFSITTVITGTNSTLYSSSKIIGSAGSTIAANWIVAVKNDSSSQQTWTVRIICWYVRNSDIAQLPT